MAKLTRVVLDVLKPRQPNIIEFSNTIAAVGSEYRVEVRVEEVDDKTESVILTVEADSIDFNALVALINELGASLHSIDEVAVCGESLTPASEL